MQRTGLLKVAQRIVVLYCIIYAIAKLVALFKGVWFYPNFIIMMGLLILGGVGGYLIKKDNYNWVYTIIGVVLISALRYYEALWVLYLHRVLG